MSGPKASFSDGALLRDASVPQFDLIVLGAGSGGLASAKRAAQWGARVLIVEPEAVGGTCVRKGCVPKKLMVEAARLGHARKTAESFGWPQAPVEHNFSVLVRARRELVARLVTNHAASLDKLGITRCIGRACHVTENSVSVATPTGKLMFLYSHLIIATGGTPIIPDLEGASLAVTSDGLFNLEALPQRLVLVGGGYIAVEFAFLMQALGSAVTLLVRGELLRAFDRGLATALERNLVQAGVTVLKEAKVRKLLASASGSSSTRVFYDYQGKQHIIEDAACVLFATGRRPQGQNLGLEALGVSVSESGAIRVDSHFATACPQIFAVGDVLDTVNLTPMAIRAGRFVADRLFKPNAEASDAKETERLVASAIFSMPPAGTVGMTEELAREKFGREISVFTTDFTPLTAAPVPKELAHRSYIKMVVHKDTDKVLGVHLVGDHAAEVIQAVAVALQAGATKKHFDETLAVHPTEAEELVLLRNAHN